MATDLRLIWLRRVLLVKSLVSIIAWGLPALIGPTWLQALFGVPIPADPIYLRLCGAMATGWGVAYWLAYKDPLRNVAIVKAGAADNALATFAVLFSAVTAGVSSAFIWTSGLLTALFCVLLLWLMPREERRLPG
jgi:hypothetical protein